MIGFTTRIFRPALAAGTLCLQELLEWAAEERFDWIELRDSTPPLTDEDFEVALSVASSRGLRMHYGWENTNLLDAADRGMFERGLRRSAALGAGTFARLTFARALIEETPGRVGYTSEEFAALCERVEAYLALAKEEGITLVFENTCEPISAENQGGYGIRDLLLACPSMKMTFDPANLTDSVHNRGARSPAEVIDFYYEHTSRFPYVHLKSTKRGVLDPTLREDGDLDLDFFRAIVAEGKLVCIELPEADDPEVCKKNVLDAQRLLLAR